MSEDGKFRVEKFNGQNYQLWKMQMEDYLYQKDLFLPLSGVAKKPTAMKDEDFSESEKKRRMKGQILCIQMYGDQIRYIIFMDLIIITVIDDATRKTWVSCIRQKSVVFYTFKKWKSLVENEIGKRLKCLRSDNGGKY